MLVLEDLVLLHACSSAQLANGRTDARGVSDRNGCGKSTLLKPSGEISPRSRPVGFPSAVVISTSIFLA